MNRTSKKLLLILLLCLFLSIFLVSCDKIEDFIDSIVNKEGDNYINITFYTSADSAPQTKCIKQDDLSSFNTGKPTKPYSTFLGFFDSPTGGGMIFDENGSPVVVINEDITVYAQYEPDIFEVTFVYEDGQVAGVYNVNFGSAIGNGPTPHERVGYDFVGWQYNKQSDNDGAMLSQNTVLDENFVIGVNEAGTNCVKLFAVYEIKKYTVTLDYNDSSVASKQITVEHGGSIPQEFLDESCVKLEDKLVTDWSQDATYMNPFEGNVTADIVLYAQWTRYKVFTLVDNPDDSTANRTVEVLEGEDLPIDNPTREGYEFDGYYTTNIYQGNPVESFSYSLTSTQLFARWIQKYYISITRQLENVLTVDVDNGFVAGSNVTLQATVEYGYQFDGYYIDGQQVCDNKLYTFEMPANDLQIEARCSAIKITATLDAGQGTCSAQEVTLIYGTEYSLPLASLSYKGFAGWSVNTETISSADANNFTSKDGLLWATNYLGTCYEANKLVTNVTFVAVFTDPSLEAPMHIRQPSDLYVLAERPSSYFLLVNDIDMSGMSWTPPETFSGVLDGRGRTISNLRLDYATTGTDTVVLGFVRRNTGTIRNVVFANAYVQDCGKEPYEYHVGIIAGENGGILDNCQVLDSYVKGDAGTTATSHNFISMVGGICGVNGGRVYYCKAYSTQVYGQSRCKLAISYAYVGGIVGKNNNIVESCIASGCTISARAGGISDWLNRSKCVYYAGGIIGSNASGCESKVSYCYSYNCKYICERPDGSGYTAGKKTGEVIANQE